MRLMRLTEPALRSSPDFAARLDSGDWFVAGAIAWLAPLVLGVAVMILGYGVVALEHATGTTMITASGLFFAIAYGLFVSPMLGLPALAAAGIAVWGLIRLGWAGWGCVAMAGALAGLIAFYLVPGVLEVTGPAMGLMYGLLFRTGLAYLRR